MKYSTLKMGNETVKLSKLGFGSMRFPKTDGVINQNEVDKMVKVAFESGVNYFDTAYVYDGSEVALGKAIKQLNRDEIYIADKMPFWGMDGQAYLDKTFEETLDRLQTEYVDFYLLHCINEEHLNQAKKYNVVKFFEDLKAQGKIKYLGFSIHASYEILVETLDLHDWDFVQIQYNYLDLNDAPGKQGYDELVKRDLPVFIMEPLKGGLLSDLVQTITQPYQKLGGSNVSYAFRWLAEQKNISVILSGMSDIGQLTENIDIFSDLRPLSAAEKLAIEEVKDNILKYQKVPCTGCKYCLPCPVNVQIPTLFKSWNTASMLTPQSGWLSGADIDYNNALKCIDCKACLKKCPQRIDIPTKIKQLLDEK